MRTLAVLPIKSFTGAKQRLSGVLASGSRQSLAQAMFSDVLAALRRCRRIDEIAVVTSDVVAESIARGDGATVLADAANDGAGQSPATEVGIRHAEAAGFDRVLLVPGDTPLIDPAEVDDLLARSADAGIAIAVVADRHGTGTNALLLSPPAAIRPSFGPGSFERHMAAARAAELPNRSESVASLAHDVDTPDDLEALAGIIGEMRGRGQRTRGALTQLGRSGARPSIGSARSAARQTLGV